LSNGIARHIVFRGAQSARDNHKVSRFQRHIQNESTDSLCYLPLLHHVLEDGHHKECVAAGMTVEQSRKAGGKAPSFELEGQVFCDIRLLKAF
jgi:hypothetical protein